MEDIMSNVKARAMFKATYAPCTATDRFAVAYVNHSTPQPMDTVFMAVMPMLDMAEYVTVSRKSSSHGGGEVMRFRPTITVKEDIRNRYGAIELGTFADVVAIRDMLRETTGKGKKINNGHAIEYMICERWGITWKLDDAPHTECGDITVDGIEYQVKFQGASL